MCADYTQRLCVYPWDISRAFLAVSLKVNLDENQLITRTELLITTRTFVKEGETSCGIRQVGAFSLHQIYDHEYEVRIRR